MMARALCAAALALTLRAQTIVPAKAGLISYADEAYVDDRSIEISPGRFVAMNENAVLRTGFGRAEVLLGPCSAMWVDEQSSLRLISSGLPDVRLELLTGSVVAATGEMIKGTKVTLLLRSSVAVLDATGVYRLDTAPPRIKVLSGRSTVSWANRTVSIPAGRLLQLDATARVVRFEKQDADPLQIWSNKRAALLARLAGQPKESGLEPTAPDSSTRKSPTGPGRLTLNTIPQTQPFPKLSGSGCGVTAW